MWMRKRVENKKPVGQFLVSMGPALFPPHTSSVRPVLAHTVPRSTQLTPSTPRTPPALPTPSSSSPPLTAPTLSIPSVPSSPQLHTTPVSLYWTLSCCLSYLLSFPFLSHYLSVLISKRFNLCSISLIPPIVLFNVSFNPSDFFLSFHWNMADMQHFRFTPKWFKYLCIYIFSCSDSFLLKIITRYWIQFLVLCSRALLVIYFTYFFLSLFIYLFIHTCSVMSHSLEHHGL